MIEIKEGKLFVNGLTLDVGGTNLSSTGKSYLLASETVKLRDPNGGADIKVQVTAYQKAK